MPARSASGSRRSKRPGLAPGRLREIERTLQSLEKSEGSGDIEIGEDTLRVTNLGKVYFPASGVTKGAVMRYYTRIWPVIQKHVTDRPLVLKRYPDGIDGQIFYQQNAGAHVPAGVRVEKVETAGEGAQARIVGGDLLTLLYTVQLGAVEVHPWLSRVGAIDTPDECLIDLDPADDVPFSSVVQLAKQIIAVAAGCSLPMAVKTSGSSGLHLVIPLPRGTSYDDSARLAMLLARAAERQWPELATVERSIKKRPAGTIYVDAMQNARGKSMAGAYSLRPRPMATASTPVSARELTSRLGTERFNIKTVPARVMRKGDLWADALATRASTRALRDAIKALSRVLENTPAATTSPSPQKRRSAGGAGVASAATRRSRRT